MRIDTDSILKDLKLNKSPKTQTSLENLNKLLEIKFNRNDDDYSIATIARESKDSGGIGEVSLRNKTGMHYRLLIDAWVAKVQTKTNKKHSKICRNNQISNDFDFINKLEDPVLRAFFGQVLSQNKRLKAENNILKSNSVFVMDNRPNEKKIINLDNTDERKCKSKQILLESEADSLKDAINRKKIERRGWHISESGAICDENNNPLFKPGFIQAITKVLSSL